MVASAPKGPANFAGCFPVRANRPVAIKTKFSAVMGAIRPVGTAPKCSGLRTNQASIPKLKPPRTSISFAHAIARTNEARARSSQRSAALRRCTIRPIPIREKQRPVLGAIGIYLARTLASRSRPEIQPMNVSRPSAIVRDAQIKGIVRKLRLSLRSSVTPLVCRNTGICPRLADF